MSENHISDTVHVVVWDGEPMLVSPDLDRCKLLAGELSTEGTAKLRIWEDVEFDVDAIEVVDLEE